MSNFLHFITMLAGCGEGDDITEPGPSSSVSSCDRREHIVEPVSTVPPEVEDDGSTNIKVKLPCDMDLADIVVTVSSSATMWTEQRIDMAWSDQEQGLAAGTAQVVEVPADSGYDICIENCPGGFVRFYVVESGQARLVDVALTEESLVSE